jgi:hypothetical protein
MRGLSRGTPTPALKFRCVRIITPPGWIVVGRGGRGGVRRLADEVRAEGCRTALRAWPCRSRSRACPPPGPARSLSRGTARRLRTRPSRLLVYREPVRRGEREHRLRVLVPARRGDLRLALKPLPRQMAQRDQSGTCALSSPAARSRSDHPSGYSGLHPPCDHRTHPHVVRQDTHRYGSGSGPTPNNRSPHSAPCRINVGKSCAAKLSTA